eukprot:jgi/Chlat1/7442/Chrsp6S00598
MAGKAASIAGKGMGFAFSLSKQGFSAIKDAVKSADTALDERKDKSMLQKKASTGSAVDHLVAVCVKFAHLLLAGYKDEHSAAAKAAAKKFLLQSKHVTYDDAILVGRILTEEASRYGDFGRSSITAAMDNMWKKLSGSDKSNPDRNKLVDDAVYTFVHLVSTGAVEQTLRQAVQLVYASPQLGGSTQVIAESFYALGYAFQKRGAKEQETHMKAVADAERARLASSSSAATSSAGVPQYPAQAPSPQVSSSAGFQFPSNFPPPPVMPTQAVPLQGVHPPPTYQAATSDPRYLQGKR